MRSDLSFEAHDKLISEILFADRKFRVPRYQRPYAWEIDQVSQFWEDLMSKDIPYFLGSFIFNTECIDDEGCVDIIDGQQRLLTITILAAVLRDIAKNIGAEQKSNLYHRKDIVFEDRAGNESLRIQPADTLVDYFREHIQSPSGDPLTSTTKTKEEDRVKRIYKFLYEKVSEEVGRHESLEDRVGQLDKIRDRVSGLVAISVEITREEDAYEIFETTNARGLDLSVADLLKNLVFRKIKPKEDKDFAKEIWQTIAEDVESTDTDLKRFFRYFWISQYQFVTDKKLFREIKNTITDWQGLLDDLEDASRKYNKLLTGDEDDYREYKDGIKIHAALFALRFMGVSQCYVLLLSILRNITRLGTSPARIFPLLEKFTFQYSVVCKLPANRVEKLYSKFALDLHKAAAGGPNEKVSNKVQALFSELERELKAEAPSKALFSESFDDLSAKNTEESRRLIKYILGRIDAFYRKTDEHKIDFNAVNIEHILPQNPSSEWGLTTKEIAAYVNKLGNLTLLSKRLNSKAQNSPINEKIEHLRGSVLPITVQLVKQLDERGIIWTKEQIAKRQQEFGDLAYERIWRL